MTTPKEHPCVFVFHAHTIGEPSSWIYKLSQQLRENGVDVLLDVWELKLGQDIYAYLENAVTDHCIEHILLMVDETYLATARDKIIEQLIRPVLYDNTLQEKVIPIINLPKEIQRELPPYLKTRMKLDFREGQAYEKLLSTIYKHNSAPPIGKRPAYLDNIFFAAPYLQKLNYSSNLDEESEIFFEDFVSGYMQANFEQYTFFSTAWREWLQHVVGTRKSPISIDTGIVIETLETLQKATASSENKEKKLLLQELFLIIIIVGFKKRNFKFLGKILQGNYYTKEAAESSTFVLFNSCQVEELQLLQQDQADKIAKYLHQALASTYKEAEIVEADLMCYYIALMQGNCWVPFLAKYQQQETYSISWLKKLDMKQFFNKTKALYGVEDASAFRRKMNLAFLQETKQLPLPYRVLPLQNTIPRVLNFKE